MTHIGIRKDFGLLNPNPKIIRYLNKVQLHTSVREYKFRKIQKLQAEHNKCQNSRQPNKYA